MIYTIKQSAQHVKIRWIKAIETDSFEHFKWALLPPRITSFDDWFYRTARQAQFSFWIIHIHFTVEQNNGNTIDRSTMFDILSFLRSFKFFFRCKSNAIFGWVVNGTARNSIKSSYLPLLHTFVLWTRVCTLNP